MKRIRQLVPSLLPALLLLAFLAGNAGAALLDRGPVVPQVVGSAPPQHGYPLWYRDTNRVPLELCLSTATSPTVAGALMCTLLPNPGVFDPALPMVFPSNYPDEGFWWTGDAVVDAIGPQGRTRGSLIMAFEAGFATGAVIPGDQITFARIRILVDTPVAGDYTVIHPYGQKTFVNVPAGNRAINYTEDIGISVGRFDGALKGSIGPFLVWDSSAPINVNGELFVGDPSVDHTVTGSPLGTNYFRIVGPAGANLDGLGNNFVQTDLFAISGKLHPLPTPTPLKVDKAVYARETGKAWVSVFATTQPLSNATNPNAPFPANFALLGTPSSLTVEGTGIPTKTMLTRKQADGEFFSSSGLFNDPGTLPATIRVTNTADVPPTVLDVPLTDEVTAQAVYRPATKALTVTAVSSDKVSPPALQVFVPEMATPMGSMTAGQFSVTFPVTDTTAIPPKTYQIPPLTVTVRSAAGGEVTVPVVAQDLP